MTHIERLRAMAESLDTALVRDAEALIAGSNALIAVDELTAEIERIREVHSGLAWRPIASAPSETYVHVIDDAGTEWVALRDGDRWFIAEWSREINPVAWFQLPPYRGGKNA